MRGTPIVLGSEASCHVTAAENETALKSYTACNPDNVPSLTCRLQVALGMARDLSYIHSNGVLHCHLST